MFEQRKLLKIKENQILACMACLWVDQERSLVDPVSIYEKRLKEIKFRWSSLANQIFIWVDQDRVMADLPIWIADSVLDSRWR